MGIFYEAARRWVGDATKVTAKAQTFVKARQNEEVTAPRQRTNFLCPLHGTRVPLYL